MDDLSRKPLEEFLDALAAKSPSPGGGAVAAAIGALAAAMGRMVLAYSIREPAAPSLVAAADRLRHADELLRALISADAAAYDRMVSATKAAKKDPALQNAAQQAVLAAIAVPLQMAALAADALHTLDEVKADTNRYLVSDLGVAAVTALAAADAAAYNVKINTPQLLDAAARTRALHDVAETCRHAKSACESIKRYVDEKMA